MEAETQRQDLLVSDAAEELIKRGQSVFVCLLFTASVFRFFSFNFEIFGIIKQMRITIKTIMETT